MNYELKLTNQAREDLLRLLVLEPECDAALPLIARVFPGKTHSDIIGSAAMATTSAELSSAIRRCEVEMAAKREAASCDSPPPSSERDLCDLFTQLGLVKREEGERRRLTHHRGLK